MCAHMLGLDMLPMLPTNTSLCGFVRQTARLERKSIGLLRLAGAYHRPTSEDRKVTQLTSFASCLLLRKAPVTQARRCLPAGRPGKNCRCSAERLDMLSLPSSCATLVTGCYGLPWWGEAGLRDLLERPPCWPLAVFATGLQSALKIDSLHDKRISRCRM